MKHPVTSHVRKARNGDCEPKDEVLSLATRRKTIQHRRILSLYRRLIEAQSRSLSLSLSDVGRLLPGSYPRVELHPEVNGLWETFCVLDRKDSIGIPRWPVPSIH